MWSPDLLNTNSVRDRNLCTLDRIHAKVGDMNLYILGGLYTIESDRDDRLVYRDVRGWWVTEGISGKATEITT